MIGVISIFVSIYYFALSKKQIKALCYSEIYLKDNLSIIFIYNRSKFHITSRDIIKEILIDPSDKKGKIFYYSILKEFSDSNISLEKRLNNIYIKIDYISPNDFLIIEIKNSSSRYFKLKGIIDNGIIEKISYRKMVFTHSLFLNIAIYTTFSTALSISILPPLAHFESKYISDEVFTRISICIIFAGAITGGFALEIIDHLRQIPIMRLKQIKHVVLRRRVNILFRQYHIILSYHRRYLINKLNKLYLKAVSQQQKFITFRRGR